MNSFDLAAIDSLEQVLCDPLTRPHWDALLSHINRLNDAEFNQLVFDQIHTAVPLHGLTGFYRGVFLGQVFLNQEELELGVQALIDLHPTQVDRVMAFLNYEWAISLTRWSTRTEFKKHLSGIRFRELLRLASSHILSSPFADSNHKQNHIAIYTPQLNDHKHPPSKLVFDYAALLSSGGYTVEVFSCQEFDIPLSSHYLSSGGRISNTSFDHSDLKSAFDSLAIDVKTPDSTLSLITRYAQIRDEICQFEPCAILFIGCYSPLIEHLFDAFPIVAMNILAQAPIGRSDLWLTSDKNEIASPSTNETTPFFHPFRMKGLTKSLQYDPSTQHQALNLLTVGARLPREIQGTWANSMSEFIKQRDGLLWTLVGGTGQLPESLRELHQLGKVKLVPHSEDIVRYYEAADIYVNPPRIGGGFSVAEAMSIGLATVSFDHCDGGDKLGPYALSSQEQFFERLSTLISSPHDRLAFGAELKKRFESYLKIDAAAPSLIEALAIAQQKFEARKELAH